VSTKFWFTGYCQSAKFWEDGLAVLTLTVLTLVNLNLEGCLSSVEQQVAGFESFQHLLEEKQKTPRKLCWGDHSQGPSIFLSLIYKNPVLVVTHNIALVTTKTKPFRTLVALNTRLHPNRGWGMCRALPLFPVWGSKTYSRLKFTFCF
jgi:hypothetical protein